MPYKDPEKKRAAQARWREKNREQHRAGVRWAKILAKYGLSQEGWDALLAAQGGRCAICPRTEPGGRGQWHVDHDHETGVVRGLLCCWCNRALGLFGDDAAVLASAVKYLETAQGPLPKERPLHTIPR